MSPQDLMQSTIDDSPVIAGDASGPMLRAFHGVLYRNPQIDRVGLNWEERGGEGRPSLATEYVDSRSVLHLSWPVVAGSVPQLLTQWLAEGTLVRDDVACLYLYEYTVSGKTVRGLIGALDAVRLSAGQVIPHEGVFEHVVNRFAERFAASRVDVEPVMLMQDIGELARKALNRIAERHVAIFLEGPTGDQHRLWRISCPSDISLLERQLAARPAVIADGHHRYTSHVRLGHHTDGVGTVLAMIVDVRDRPLHLKAIHRVITGLTFDQLEARLALSTWSGSTRYVACSDTEAIGYLEASPKGTFLVGDGDRWMVCGGDPDGVDVVHIHEVFLPGLGIKEREVEYRDQWTLAVGYARQTSGLALILRPPKLEEVLDAANRGNRLPQKATAFGPKPPVSLVLRSF